MRTLVTKTCPHCNKQYTCKPSEAYRRTYCSVKCVQEVKKEKHKFTCEYCGTVGYSLDKRPNRERHFCNQKCMGAFYATLDYSQSFLDQTTAEHLDGFLLGDGHITPKNSHFTWSVKYKEFDEYIQTCFKSYGPSSQLKYTKNEKFKEGGSWMNYGRTTTHPDLYQQRSRWYPDGIKIVPKDVIITPKSVLFWYLGDGTRSGVNLSFATDGFTPDDVYFLVDKLKSIGINSHRDKNNHIVLLLDSIRPFFDYVGWECPIKCYDYKFGAPIVIRTCKSTSEIAQELGVAHHTVYNYGSRLFPNKQKSVNCSLWWTDDEQAKIKEVLV